MQKLEETALEMAHRFGQHHGSSISGVKKLVNYSLTDLEGYLQFENQEISRIARTLEFERQMQGMGPNPSGLVWNLLMICEDQLSCASPLAMLETKGVSRDF